MLRKSLRLSQAGTMSPTDPVDIVMVELLNRFRQLFITAGFQVGAAEQHMDFSHAGLLNIIEHARSVTGVMWSLY